MSNLTAPQEKMSKNLPRDYSELRIIGGSLRSRKIIFKEVQGLRPTPNRIRETVFNWLAPEIRGASCFDMFAGSGALGFEALSRGASYCLMTDSSKEVIACLKENQQHLSLTNLDIIEATFPYPSGLISKKFDIVFLDPPFHYNYIESASAWLTQSGCLKETTLIYVEAERELEVLSVPPSWIHLKDKSAGQVRYCLFRVT